jgi:hypothetical protein
MWNKGFTCLWFSPSLRQRLYLRTLVCFCFLMQLPSSLLMSSSRAQWRGPLSRKLSIITFAVCHYCLKSLDMTVAERLKSLEANTSKWIVNPRRSSWKTCLRLYSLEVLKLKERIQLLLMIVPRSVYTLIVEIVYSSRHGHARLLVMISPFVLLLPDYSNCTSTGQLRIL